MLDLCMHTWSIKCGMSETMVSTIATVLIKIQRHAKIDTQIQRTRHCLNPRGIAQQSHCSKVWMPSFHLRETGPTFPTNRANQGSTKTGAATCNNGSTRPTHCGQRIPQTTIQRLITSMRRRCTACTDAGGGHTRY